MHLELSDKAIKDMSRMPAGIASNMRQRLRAIAVDPFATHGSVERLKGAVNTFRLRVGGWRAVYTVDVESQTMFVERVEPRGEVYR